MLFEGIPYTPVGKSIWTPFVGRRTERNARTIDMLLHSLKWYCHWTNASLSRRLISELEKAAYLKQEYMCIVLHYNRDGSLINMGVYWWMKNYYPGHLNKMGVQSRRVFKRENTVIGDVIQCAFLIALSVKWTWQKQMWKTAMETKKASFIWRISGH